MTEVRHTPGPWSIVTYGDGDSLVIHDGESENRICFMATHGGSRAQWERIQANAGLIVTAPELFETQTKLCNELSGTLELYETGLRQLMGNTNFNVLAQRCGEAREALTKVALEGAPRDV